MRVASVNFTRDANVQELVSLVGCMLLLLIVPKDATTVLADIGVTESRLESLMVLTLVVVLMWHAVAIANSVYLCFLMFERMKRTRRDRSTDVRVSWLGCAMAAPSVAVCDGEEYVQVVTEDARNGKGEGAIEGMAGDVTRAHGPVRMCVLTPHVDGSLGVQFCLVDPLTRSGPNLFVVCQHLGAFGVEGLPPGSRIVVTMAVGRAVVTLPTVYQQTHAAGEPSTLFVLPIMTLTGNTDLSTSFLHVALYREGAVR